MTAKELNLTQKSDPGYKVTFFAHLKGVDMPSQLTQEQLDSWFWPELERYLSSNQLKITQQRQDILDYIVTLDKHIDAETLNLDLKQKGKNIGLATIYRTLNLLTKAGLLGEQSFADGRTVFELNPPGEHHDHLICLDCGRIVEFENEAIEALQHEIASSHDLTLESHRLDMYGRCKLKVCPHKGSPQ